MGYKITYSGAEKETRPVSNCRKGQLTMLIFSMFLFWTMLFWPEGREVLKALLIPGDPETTLAAAEAFAGELGRGAELGEAVSAFCASVLSHGHPG